MSAYTDGLSAAQSQNGWWIAGIANLTWNARPGYLAALQNLGMYRQSLAQRAQQRRNTACQWFATKWRARSAEIGVQAAARLMRKQGIPCDVAVSILATR